MSSHTSDTHRPLLTPAQIDALQVVIDVDRPVLLFMGRTVTWTRPGRTEREALVNQNAARRLLKYGLLRKVGECVEVTLAGREAAAAARLEAKP